MSRVRYLQRSNCRIVMSIPHWIKLVASSDQEKLAEALKKIDEMGGIYVVEDALARLPSTTDTTITASLEKSDVALLSIIGLLAALLGIPTNSFKPTYSVDKALDDIGAKHPELREQIKVWMDKSKPSVTVDKIHLFDTQIREAAKNVDLKGIPVEALVVLFGHETGWGTGTVFQKTNNPGSITAATGQPAVADRNGQRVAIFPDLETGIKAEIELLHRPRYEKALEAAKALVHDSSSTAKNKFYDELSKAGYGPIGEDYAARLRGADKFFQNQYRNRKLSY